MLAPAFLWLSMRSHTLTRISLTRCIQQGLSGPSWGGGGGLGRVRLRVCWPSYLLNRLPSVLLDLMDEREDGCGGEGERSAPPRARGLLLLINIYLFPYRMRLSAAFTPP